MTKSEREEARKRCEKATSGPWYYRAGRHTTDARTSDAGGIHTSAGPVQTNARGEKFVQDNILFPIITFDGPDKNKIHLMMMTGKLRVAMAMEIWAAPDDMQFLCSSRTDLPRALDHIDRCHELLRLAVLDDRERGYMSGATRDTIMELLQE